MIKLDEIMRLFNLRKITAKLTSNQEKTHNTWMGHADTTFIGRIKQTMHIWINEIWYLYFQRIEHNELY